MRVLFFLLSFLATLSAAARAPEDNLPRKLAAARREQIRSLRYQLDLAFRAGADTYSGQVKISAELADLSQALSLDWKGPRPDSVAINGTPVTDFLAEVGSLEIPAARLAKSSLIEIHFSNSFSKEGEGIQHIVDPIDKQEYIYTDFEPYEAHQVFPCVDQPDIKAPLALTITAPRAWIAIGNELVESVADTVPGVNPPPAGPASDSKVTKFRQTPPLSPYLYFMGAGPFREWKDQEGKTALVLYARQSLAQYVDAENLFATIKKGLRFYSGYFDFEYPFSKFGLVFAPEFGWGGMENPGAIVVNEKNLFRGPVTATRREGRDGLILHEMAHHWFGDLVTMTWWNDLWLNESFASYAASLALDRAFQSKIAWQNFALEKGWAYWQDQLPTTHPIETPVLDTRTARGNFDGITYSKGASALQQLHFFVGEDAFRNGLRAYFRAHAFGNAARADFVGAVAAAGHRNLDTWTHDWLETAGVNRVHATWTCADGQLGPVTLLQEKSRSGTLSPHRTRLGFFRAGAGADALELARTWDSDYSTARNSLKGEPTACPAFVFPNLDDKDYALFSLDPVSLQHAEAVLKGAGADPLLRAGTWMILNQMVRDAELKPRDFLRIAQGGLEQEKNEGMLDYLLGRESPILGTLGEYLTLPERTSLVPAFENLARRRLEASEKGGDDQMRFFDFYLHLSRTPDALARIAAWLATPPPGLTLDPDRRWEMLIALARHGYASAADLITAEEARDASDLSRRMAATARVALPQADAKVKFWKGLDHPETIPPSTLRRAAVEFREVDYPQLSRPYVSSYFARLRTVPWEKSDSLVGVYFSLFPRDLCAKDVLRDSRKALASAKNLTSLARRHWLEENDELERCVRVREKAKPSI